MARADLSNYTLEQLKQLQKDVAKAIAGYQARQKSEAQAKLEAMAREMGFSLNDLVAPSGKGKRRPATPKYRHPETPDVTWSGRGRRPQWIVEALEAGLSEDDLLIKG